jgi:CheY-like chemotaxis protein/HPt (histidine-containing phosphotransfer) domain-containing protein
VLNIDIDENVPNVVCGDEGRLKQIFYNLVGNSLMFTEQGGIFVQVSTLESSSNIENVILQVSVRDTGVGIPEDKQSLIFESFRQADDSTTRKFGGSGLGLAISRELVEMMGGSIGVRSSEGYGSVFTFHVVLQQGRSEVVALEFSSENTNSFFRADVKCRILVVEDNPINVRVATSLLKKMGHSVYVASNGEEAVSQLSNLDVDLVLMDLEMPKMDGFEAARHIRNGECGKSKRDIPIVAMSAHAMAGVKEKCEQVGMNEYIAKPVQYLDLQEVILSVANKDNRSSNRKASIQYFDNTVLDKKKAVEMYHGDEVLYQELCGMFVVDVPNDIIKFSDAVACGDKESAKRIVHTLKSSCAAICATSACDKASNLERALLRGDQEAVLRYIQDFSAEYAKVESELTI